MIGGSKGVLMTTVRRVGASARARVRVLEAGGSGVDVIRRDDVATEEPLQIRVAAGAQRSTVAITMRTPGHDFELATGWLAAEGVIGSLDDIEQVDYCTDMDVAAEQQYNVVTVTLRGSTLPDLVRLDRHGYVSSACGVCGKADLEALELQFAPVEFAGTVAASTLYGLPATLRAGQGVFARTGGLHAAGLGSLTGELSVVREDVGRHNAVDKAIGHRLLNAHPPGSLPILAVSGRTSFEIVQKAVAARIAVVAGISAPSSLAIDVADRFGVTLVGFLRENRANVYTHADRIAV